MFASICYSPARQPVTSEGVNAQMETEGLGAGMVEEWMAAQRGDTAMARVWLYVDRGKEPTPRERVSEDGQVRTLLRQWGRLCVHQGLLCREVVDPKTREEVKQILVPSSLRKRVMAWVHDGAGHLAVEKVGVMEWVHDGAGHLAAEKVGVMEWVHDGAGHLAAEKVGVMEWVHDGAGHLAAEKVGVMEWVHDGAGHLAAEKVGVMEWVHDGAGHLAAEKVGVMEWVHDGAGHLAAEKVGVMEWVHDGAGHLAVEKVGVMEWVHDGAGHLAVEKVGGVAWRRFIWPGMYKQLKEYCQKCERCGLRKTPTAKVCAPLVPIKSMYPLQMVSVDFLSLEASRSGMCWS
ncbi:uncharacterized protein LOC125726484 isoform X4 [Brienomyrus brachyistius]|uniref:uncharacterized protein LOC125726484 isoform X4 n=1 Tax=Brienomyrus brachyistius TaxID=42636 RepID=UPI0020B317A1|nr:uncharacterized protein LOC125726484 isoform X4 [Brienomyrus brachyistius]